jgi:PHD/YefM family antitoxin component YafN of YafNO toxin-antitoxin module
MASRSEQFIVNNQGKKTAVLIPMKRYERIMADLHDLAVVAERKEEKPISLTEMKKRLKKDGII